MLNSVTVLREDLIAFLEMGGDVMPGIFVTTFVMWVLIAERYAYLHFSHRGEADALLGEWRERQEHDSWFARQVRRQLVAIHRDKITSTLGIIKALVALCPMLGLLGTVTGMIKVFDVMAVAGSGNPRAMASGVSQATVSTMAGMVAAISGLVFSARLNRRADKETRLFEDHLG